MMLVRVDPVTYKITLVTVPRDTEADYEGSVVKINELYRQGGMEAAVEGVESLTGVHVQYYLDMGFVGFEKFVDQIGGVTANVPIDMHLKDIVNGGTIELNAGTQELERPRGPCSRPCAQAVRCRHRGVPPDPGPPAGRGGHQTGCGRPGERCYAP